MRPVTAWLAQLDERIRALVMPVAPDLLIEDGDPAILPTLDRERVLEQFAKSYRGRNDAGISIDINQIARLADPMLARKIRALWEEAFGSGELRELLLRIIWIGKIESCGDIALVAATGRRRYYERALGSRALGEIGTPAQRRTLADHLLTNVRSYPKKAFAEALQAVFPSVLSFAELETLIRKCPSDNMKALHSGLSYGLSRISQHSDLPDPEKFAHLLHKLAAEKPWVDERYRAHSKRFSALRAPLADLCTRMTREAGGAPLNLVIAEAARFAGLTSEDSGNFQTGEARKRLSEAVSKNVGANSQQFWLAIEGERAKHGELFGNRVVHGLGELWRLSARDFDWLLTDLETKALADDKKIALSAALAAWIDGGKDHDKLKVIRGAIVGNKELEEQLENTLNPPESDEDEWKRQHEKWRAEIRAKRDKKHQDIKESWRDFRDRLVAEPDKLRDGAATSDLYDLARWMGWSQRDTYSHRDWQAFAAPFSTEVAKAARDGFVVYWRTFDPGVRYARKNSTPWRAVVALVGLAIESAEMPDLAANSEVVPHCWTGWRPC